MWHGAWVPLITPFTSSFEIDYSTLRELVLWHIEQKVDGLLVCGTTGEAPTLTEEEHFTVVKTVAMAAKGKVPIIAGTGTYDTRKSVKLTESVAKLGIDGCLVVVPYYTRPTPEGCLAHYKEIAKVALPICLYHHPGRTGTNLSIEAMSELTAIPQIEAIKEASCDLNYVKDVINATRKPILSSDDAFIVPMIKLGAVGAFSMAANLIPEVIKQMVISA